jgi:CRP-like cAMP-binding protein
MSDATSDATLQTILEERGEKIRMPKGTVLFRRGAKATGMFLVLTGKLSLDFGTGSALTLSYGPGTLVGLPATVTRRNHSMTATVKEDAQLGFWSPEALDSLLRDRPGLYQDLLTILVDRMAENRESLKKLVERHAKHLLPSSAA